MTPDPSLPTPLSQVPSTGTPTATYRATLQSPFARTAGHDQTGRALALINRVDMRVPPHAPLIRARVTD